MEQILNSLLQLTQEKARQMRLLLELNLQHAVLLQAEDVDALADLLGRKQAVMDQVDQLDQAVQKLTVVLEDSCGADAVNHLAGSSAVARQIIVASDEVRTTVRELIEVDQRNSELSRQLLAQLKQRMERLTQSANASRSYNSTGRGSGPPSIYMNRKI